MVVAMENLLFFNWVLNNLDLVLILLILGFSAIGAFRGFFAQLGGTLTTIIGIIVAIFLSKGLMALLCKFTNFDDALYNSFIQFINNKYSFLSSVELSKLETTVTSLPFPEAVRNSVLNFCNSQNASVVNVGEALATYLAQYAILLICFIIIFILVKLGFFLLRRFGENLREIEIVRKVDTVLGAFLAVFSLYRKLSLIFLIISIIPFGFLHGLSVAVSSSHIATFITNFNFFGFVLSLVEI